MGRSFRLVSILVLVLCLGVATSGETQPPCQGCFTTPLAASGNGSCFVNMCFTVGTGGEIQITSIQQVTGTNCSALLLTGGIIGPQFLAAVEKEAIRINLQNCHQCTGDEQTVTAKGPACFTKPNTTWLPCSSAFCTTTYKVTCDPLDPYEWKWGEMSSSLTGDCGLNTSCHPTCPRL